MSTPKYFKDLNAHGIRDGLLRDFIYRGLYSAAVAEVDTAIAKRCDEIEFLTELKESLVAEPTETEG